jgi:hypothetical protein
MKMNRGIVQPLPRIFKTSKDIFSKIA